MSRIQGDRRIPSPLTSDLPKVAPSPVRRPDGQNARIKRTVAVSAISLATISVGVAAIHYLSGDRRSRPVADRENATSTFALDDATAESVETVPGPSLAVRRTSNDDRYPPGEALIDEVLNASSSPDVDREARRARSTAQANAQPSPAHRTPLTAAPSFGRPNSNAEVRPDSRRKISEALAALHARGPASRTIPGRVGPPAGGEAIEAASERAAVADLASEFAPASAAAPGGRQDLERSAEARSALPSSASAAIVARPESGPQPALPGSAQEPIVDTSSVSAIARSSVPSAARPDEPGGRPGALSDPSSEPLRTVDLSAGNGNVAGGELTPSASNDGVRQAGLGAELSLQPSADAPATGSSAGLAAVDPGRSVPDLSGGRVSTAAQEEQGRLSSTTGGLGRRNPADAGASTANNASLVPLRPSETAAPERSASPGRAGPGSRIASVPQEQGPASPLLSGRWGEDDLVLFSTQDRSGRASLQAPERLRIATVSIGSGGERTFPGSGDKASRQGTPSSGAIDSVPLVQTREGTVSVRLEDLIGLLEKKMERPLFVWLKSSGSASKYVTFETLRAAGIGVDYDPSNNHLVLSAPESSRP